MLTLFRNNSVPNAKPRNAKDKPILFIFAETRTPGFFRNSSNYLTTMKAVKSSNPCTPRLS